MSNETTPQRLLAAPVSTPESPALDLHEIQGDVLIGLQKSFERFVFFRIAEVAEFKSVLRKRIAHRVTSTLTVKAREFELRDHKTNGGKEPLPLVGLNLGFTKTGIKKLLPAADLGDASFDQGAAALASTLGMHSMEQESWPTGSPSFFQTISMVCSLSRAEPRLPWMERPNMCLVF
jgi:hypothetical protein